jgi:SAM-dependent methyltransferase
MKPICAGGTGTTALRARLFWQAYAAVYDALWDQALTRHVGEAVTTRLIAGAPVVEIGAGTGLITRALLDSGHAVLAVEPAAAMRRRGIARAPEATWLANTAEDVRLDGHPRTVVAVNSLHTMRDPVAGFAHLRRIAAGGQVLIVSPTTATSMRGALAAQRLHGVGTARRLRFVGLHLLLAPLTAIARTGLSPVALSQIGDLLPEASDEISGGLLVALVAGQAGMTTVDVAMVRSQGCCSSRDSQSSGGPEAGGRRDRLSRLEGSVRKCD